MSKNYKIIFSTSEIDKRLLDASLAALNSEVLAARFSYCLEFDDTAQKYTLTWWHVKGTGDVSK